MIPKELYPTSDGDFVKITPSMLNAGAVTPSYDMLLARFTNNSKNSMDDFKTLVGQAISTVMGPLDPDVDDLQKLTEEEKENRIFKGYLFIKSDIENVLLLVLFIKSEYDATVELGKISQAIFSIS